jgi:hypothetical protein
MVEHSPWFVKYINPAQVQEQCVPDGQRISVVVPEQVQWQAKTPWAGVKF